MSSSPGTRGRGGLFPLATLVLAILAVWWRGPDWNTVYHAFDFVSWRWVIVGILLNLLSVIARAWAWNLTIHQAMPPPRPPFRQVFSSFGVGLLGNAVLPARAGELARVAVLCRHLPHGKVTSATLLGTVFAHRLFDLGRPRPHRLRPGDREAAPLGGHGRRGCRARRVGMLAVAVMSALTARRRPDAEPTHRAQGAGDGAAGPRSAPRARRRRRGDLLPDRRVDLSAPRRLGRHPGVRSERAAARGCARPAPDEHRDVVPALARQQERGAAPGRRRAAVAQYGVAYGTGFAYGLVLQAVEMSVGVGVGLVMLAREGLSLAALKRMEDDEEASAEDVLEEVPADEPAEEDLADERPYVTQARSRR